jgi:transcriptional regulator with PAS, ATPase and Fis domain
MSFTARANKALNRDLLDQLMEAPAFHAVADLLSYGIIVVDLEDNVAFINSAVEKLSGIERSQVVKQSLETFIRRSGLDMDEWLATPLKVRDEGLIRKRTTGDLITASRRIITVSGKTPGYTLITLQVSPERIKSFSNKSPSTYREQRELLLHEPLNGKVQLAIRAYQRKARVIILGESGVGKTVIAMHIHNENTDNCAPFVHVNCASITESLFDSEMFGYERGAFTGALQAGKKGYVEAAKGGTLFLDEIGEIPIANQAKLLKFLEDGTIQPVGSVVSKRIETTVITATNRNLRNMVNEGTFREDLFYRIATFPLTIPPLRERSDKESILDSLIDRVNELRTPKLKLNKACRKKLLGSKLVGNIRELRSIVDYLDIAVDSVATSEDLSSDIFHYADALSLETTDADDIGERTLKERVQLFEMRAIDVALSNSKSKREAAGKLGMDVATLIRKQQRNLVD